MVNRDRWVLTERGERVAGVLYGCAIAAGMTVLILGTLLVAGAIEGLN
jgi:hypothetical protein